MKNEDDFLIERRLRALDIDLHSRFKDCVAIMPTVLSHYINNFPYFTDHSMRHAMDVIEFCNKLIGVDYVDRLNAYEIFVLLMGIYLHDMGMGISEKEYFTLYPEMLDARRQGSVSTENLRAGIRFFHQEISGELVRKYAALFELDDARILHAVIQIVRGHRITDLMNEQEYPLNYEIRPGISVCLPYLAALIRLADEIDVGAGRNSFDMYRTAESFAPPDQLQFIRHDAIREVRVEKDAFVLCLRGSDTAIQAVLAQNEKMLYTLNYCRGVVNGRTQFFISQKEIRYVRES